MVLRQTTDGRIPWADHLGAWDWEQGDHVTLIGPAKAGKTTLAGAILPRRSYVVGFACKRRDPTLEQIIRDHHYRVVRSWDEIGPRRRDGDRVVLWPGRPRRFQVRDQSPDEFEAAQYREFSRALREIYMEGAWTPWIDELSYMADYLGLERETDRLFRQGRSDAISMVSSTQQPVNVPRNSFDQAMHLYLWRMRDAQRIRRCAEISGAVDPRSLASELGRLRDHEVLYVDGATGETRRTRVDVD